MKLILSEDGRSAAVIDHKGRHMVDRVPAALVCCAPPLLVAATLVLRRMTPEELKQPAVFHLKAVVETICDDAGIKPEDLDYWERLSRVVTDRENPPEGTGQDQS